MSRTPTSAVIAHPRRAEGAAGDARGAVALVVTADEALREDLRRLAAAAGVPLAEVADAADALPAWSTAGTVLVGGDVVDDLAALHPPPRGEVHVVARTTPGATTYRGALELGAQGVVELPAAEAWLGDLFADLGEGDVRRALTVAVVPGAGGAGASVLAAALAQTGAGAGPVTLLDLDPSGAGADRLLGLEDEPGLRWPDLTEVRGRVSSRSLRAALPGAGSLKVLSWGRSDISVPARVAVEVLAASQRGADLVVIDVPRVLDQPGVCEVVRRADAVVVCVRGTVLQVTAASRLTTRMVELGVPVGLAVRTGGTHVDPADVADTLALPLLAEYTSRRRVEELLDTGLGPLGSGRAPLDRAARSLLTALGWAP